MKSTLVRGSDLLGFFGLSLLAIGAALVVMTLLGGCVTHEGERVNVAGVEFEGMAWSIDCERYPSAERARLDKRYQDEVAALYSWNACEVGDPLPDGSMVSSVAECHQFHRVWRRYHAASRELAACPR